MMMMMKRLVTVFYVIHLLHGGYATLSDSDSLDDETIEISNESDDSYSMEELTTVSNSLNLPVQQHSQPFINDYINPPIQTQIATISEIITQTASPLLMKLIAPVDTTDPSIETPITETPVDTSEDTDSNSSSSSADDSSEAESAKKPRRLPSELTEIAVTTLERSKEINISDNSMEDDTTTIPDDVETEINETNIDISEEVTTINPFPSIVTVSPTSTSSSSSSSSSTSKRPPKNIEIFKTKPNELLRFYVEDGHLRSPIAALVDKKPNPLSKSKKLWKAALRPNSLLDIMVVSYDSEGIKSTYNLTNTKAMMSTLDKVREENITDQESKTYYSIIRTGQLIPFDSAIFLSTDDLPNDTEHQLQASMFLLKKRIRVSFSDLSAMFFKVIAFFYFLFFFSFL